MFKPQTVLLSGVFIFIFSKMTDITATEQDRTLDKDKENNETLAMVISRRKKNGMDLRSEGNGEKKVKVNKQEIILMEDEK